MGTAADATDLTFNEIPPEPWGRRLSRVREDVADLTLNEADERANHYMVTSYGSISRLERLAEPPSGRLRRQLAFVLCRVYNVDPAEFGLNDEDVPPALRAARLPTGRYIDAAFRALPRRLAVAA